MQVVLTDPDCELTVAFREDYQVTFGPTDLKPDVTLFMRGDIADQFWRGDYNLATGIIKREVKTRVMVAGPTKTLLDQLVPLAEPLRPLYREKDAEVAGEWPPCRTGLAALLGQLAPAAAGDRKSVGAVGAKRCRRSKARRRAAAVGSIDGRRLLGPMERLLILGLGLAGQLAAATAVTEYFLVGSFASWIVALGGLVLAQ